MAAQGHPLQPLPKAWHRLVTPFVQKVKLCCCVCRCVGQEKESLYCPECKIGGALLEPLPQAWHRLVTENKSKGKDYAFWRRFNVKPSII